MSVANPQNIEHFEIVQVGFIVPATPLVASAPVGQFGYAFTTDSVEHGLGYVPACIGYVQNTETEFTAMPYYGNPGQSTSTQGSWFGSYLFVDDTHVTLNRTLFVTGAPGGLTDGSVTKVKYYLLRETSD